MFELSPSYQLSGTNEGDVRQKDTNKLSLASSSKTVRFKTKKHEIFSLTVAVFYLEVVIGNVMC